MTMCHSIYRGATRGYLFCLPSGSQARLSGKDSEGTAKSSARHRRQGDLPAETFDLTLLQPREGQLCRGRTKARDFSASLVKPAGGWERLFLFLAVRRRASAFAKLYLFFDFTDRLRRYPNEFHTHSDSRQAIPNLAPRADFRPGERQPERQDQHRPFGEYLARRDEHPRRADVRQPRGDLFGVTFIVDGDIFQAANPHAMPWMNPF